VSDDPKPVTDKAKRISTGPGVCRSCKAPIFWVDINDKMHPVDREITPDGNIVLWRKEETGYLHGKVLKKNEVPPPGCVTRKSHFATCPNSKEHRHAR